jgi:hypothetical protein
MRYADKEIKFGNTHMSDNIKELKQKISGHIVRNSKGEYIEISDETAMAILEKMIND